ncbi:peptidase [Rhodococcus sp. P1Y]|nr:peptidase [Rhodococcus sp. P1Y]
MKLFLASYRFGAHADEFVSLTSGPGRVAVVANAADGWPPAARSSAVLSEIRGLRDLGFDPFELDLRAFVDRPADLDAVLDSVPTLWVRGGNTFVLASRLEQCGAGDAISSRVRGGSLVFAGYSAGACIAQTSLHGIELADDPAEVRIATGGEVTGNGLGLVDLAFVPHYRSILDDLGAGPSMVAGYERDNVPHVTLTDEQVYLVDSDRAERI